MLPSLPATIISILFAQREGKTENAENGVKISFEHKAPDSRVRGVMQLYFRNGWRGEFEEKVLSLDKNYILLSASVDVKPR